MKSILQNRLASLDAKYKRKVSNQRLRVFYGWAKVNKIRKNEAISVIFENDSQKEDRAKKFINRMQDTVYVRDQTEDEKIGIENESRSFTEYSIFMNDREVKGSLALALKYNSDSDKNNVSLEEREVIKNKLREHYLSNHPGYKEPVIQLEIDFEFE